MLCHVVPSIGYHNWPTHKLIRHLDGRGPSTGTSKPHWASAVASNRSRGCPRHKEPLLEELSARTGTTRWCSTDAEATEDQRAGKWDVYPTTAVTRWIWWIYFQWPPPRPWHIIYSDIVSDIPSGNIYGIYILYTYYSDILSDILSGICIWHIFWHTFWHSIRYIVGDSLWLRSGGERSAPELAARVRRGTLRSSACSWGPAGITLILSLLFGSGEETLRSSACSWGPCLLFGSGGQWGKLRSSWGPAGNTLILNLLFGSGGERCDLALAVEVRRGSLWSWACCSGPAGNTAI